MAVIDGTLPMAAAPRARLVTTILSLAAALVGGAIAALMWLSPAQLAPFGIGGTIDALPISLFAAAAVFMALGGIVAIPRLGLGGVIALIGALFWIAASIVLKNFGWLTAIPLVLAFLGALTGMIANDRRLSASDG